MGARVKVEVKSAADEAEPYGDVTITGGELKGTKVGGSEIPKLIDELPLVAILGALAAARPSSVTRANFGSRSRIAFLHGNEPPGHGR